MEVSHVVLHSDQCSKHFVMDANTLFAREPVSPSTNSKLKRIITFGLCVTLLLKVFVRPLYPTTMKLINKRNVLFNLNRFADEGLFMSNS